MKKVILIAFYFNQVNEIASKRLRALAKYLPQFGWDVIVIAPDLGFIPDDNENLNCRIVLTEYEDMFSHMFNKFNFLSNGSRESKNDDLSSISNDSGKVDGFSSDDSGKVDGFSSDDSGKVDGSSSKGSDKLRDSTSVSNPLVSKAISMAGEVFAYPDGMKYWRDAAFREASRIIDEEEIDAIISSSWPITAHEIAKDLSDSHGIPWIADLRDLWNLNPYISHTFIRDFFERRLEEKTFENTDILTTTTDLAAETLATLHPNNRIVPVLSGYDEDDFKLLESLSLNSDLESDNFNDLNSSDDSSKLKLIYAGSLYGGKRDPTILFKSIRQLEDENKIDSSKISIEFYGDSGNTLDIARSFNLENIVKIGGRISHEDVLKKQSSSDVLLLISWNNEKEKMFIPGKVYEYFALRKPVLSIGYKEGSLKDLIEKTNVGYHVSDLESCKEVLLEIYNEFLDKGIVEFKSDINIDEYSMVSMASKFADLLNDISN